MDFPLPISLCAIVKNESDSIVPYVEYFRRFVRQIVVVDTGSADGTPQKARAEGAQVFEIPWPEDFSAARNYGLGKALEPWILALDPDEKIDERDFEAIGSAISDGTYDAWILKYRIYYREFAGQVGWIKNTGSLYHDCPGYIEMPKIRLFRNGKGIVFRGAVHELLEYFLKEKHVPAGRLDIPVHHKARTRTKDEIKARAAFYLPLLRKNLEAGIDPQRTLFDMGLSHYELGNYGESARFLKQAYDAGLRRRETVCMLANTLRKTGEYDALEAYIVKAERDIGSDEYVLSEKGKLLFEKGDMQAAQKIFRQVVSINPSRSDAWCNMGICFMRLGNIADARESFFRAVQAQPADTQAAFLLKECEKI